jgi:1-acyl-sn-glycerol-3-phosphate acyltransferase
MQLFKKIKFLYQLPAIVLVTITDSLIVIVAYVFKRRKYNFFKHYQGWADRILKISGIKLKIIGASNVKSDETYIYASNHSSMFDIPIIFYSLKNEIRIIYKKELEKIPVFGYQLRKSPFIAVTRNDPRKSMQSLEEAIEIIKQNINVIIFPEGTRSKDGKVADFKRGAFMIASKSGKPIIPVTIIGSSEIMPKGKLFFEPKDVQVIIHPPVYYPENLSKQDEKKLMDDVRNTIISGFGN